MPESAGRRATVFVVDDDDDVRATIEDALSLDGYNVIAIENGEQALGALAVATPQLVVTDLEMPVTDGLRLIRRIQSDRRTKDVPICVVTAALDRVPERLIVVKKPFDVGELREVIRAVLARTAAPNLD